MPKIFTHVVGNTLGSHMEFLKKLTKRGATVVSSPAKSDVTIVFCPIVSRFETDINSALSSASGWENVILVAMHHTFDENYTIPNHRVQNHPVVLLVDCLFFEQEGLFRCSRNKKAVKMVRKELCLQKNPLKRFFKKRLIK